MNRPRVRVGIVGAGWVAAARHIPSYRRHPDATVVAIYDHGAGHAERAAAELGIPHAYSNLECFLDDNIDVVSICTPPWAHAEIAIAALRRGCHVFTEKPMAMNEGEALDMADAARTSNRLLCVSHNFLFSRAVSQADGWLRSSDVNYGFALQLSSLRRRLPSWYEDLPGGLLMDEVPHLLYTLQHFLGPLKLDDVRGVGRTDGGGFPTVAEIRVAGTNGPGQITTVLASPVSEWHVGLICDDIAVDLDLFRDIAVRVRSDNTHEASDILRTSASAMWSHSRGFAASGARYVAKRQFWGHDEIIRRFVDAVLGRGDVPVRTEDAISVVQLSDEILSAMGAPRTTA